MPVSCVVMRCHYCVSDKSYSGIFGLLRPSTGTGCYEHHARASSAAFTTPVNVKERAALDVFVPPITRSPVEGDVWVIGQQRNGTWWMPLRVFHRWYFKARMLFGILPTLQPNHPRRWADRTSQRRREYQHSPSSVQLRSPFQKLLMVMITLVCGFDRVFYTSDCTAIESELPSLNSDHRPSTVGYWHTDVLDPYFNSGFRTAYATTAYEFWL
ncbi:hypothetical protein D9758_015584 [Tetrapyrgos nigripes]|uniref:Uncharacterized protein n=1 Tax=Tetrapyrgos nigripes TaxID=182062 RepID=A0A8H5CEL8_9AGAR|nr:hypothetical protein D9758_015584 [Tetrapyrgos nigripes]